MEEKLKEQASLTEKAESRFKHLENDLRETREKAIQSDTAAKKVEEDRKATQNELDDLLMVFGDLEEKVAKYKVNGFWSVLVSTLTMPSGPTQSTRRNRLGG